MLIRLVLTEIQPLKNVKITEKCWVIRAVSNFDVFKWLYLAYYWVYLHQTWGFCKAWYALKDYVDQ